METKNNTCINCVWNNECYIQNAIKAYMRHRQPKFKIDLNDFYCNSFESIEQINQAPPAKDDNDYLNFYSSE